MRPAEKSSLALATLCGLQWLSFGTVIIWPHLGFSPRAAAPLITLDILACLASLVGLILFFSSTRTRITRTCLAIFLLQWPLFLLQFLLATAVLTNAFM